MFTYRRATTDDIELIRSGDFDIGGGFFMNDHIMRKELY